jgi:cytochrome c biogenesis protein CcdA
MIEKAMRVLIGIDRMSMKTRINIACYLISLAIYTAGYFSFGLLGVFLYGIVSLLIYEKIPYLTMISLLLVVASGTWMFMDITGLGLKMNAALDWLFGQPFAKPIK